MTENGLQTLNSAACFDKVAVLYSMQEKKVIALFVLFKMELKNYEGHKNQLTRNGAVHTLRLFSCLSCTFYVLVLLCACDYIYALYINGY